MGAWDAVIDVSNVCWSPYLPPVGRRRPFWERLYLIMTAWQNLHGDDVSFRLVADDSLTRALADSRELRRLKGIGDLVTTPVADAVILPMARDEGLHVITRDHYVDHRTGHPWIEQFPGRFHSWDTVDGEVRITPLGITRVSAQEVSMAIELKDLKRTRVDPRNPVHRRILHTRWRCANTSCVQAAHWQEQLLVWPLVSVTGEAMCPSCDKPLTPLGPRTHLYEVVVADRSSQAEITRFPLEADIPLIVGRGQGVKGIDLAMDDGARYDRARHDAVLRVSRLHLLLWLEEVSAVNWRLAAIDLESTNGTEVERWNGAGFLPSRPVPNDRETFLSARDRLVLGGAVQLRLSGKRYARDAGTPPPAPRPEPGSTAAGETVTDRETLPRLPDSPAE